MTKAQFISEIAKYVREYAPHYGICVHSPIIAQAILESACGTSELALNANNFFGLKYKSYVTPLFYSKIGSEQNEDGSYTSSPMIWCKFTSFESGVKGYFDFISAPRYENLKGITSPLVYLETIKANYYASSKNYVKNLMDIIDKYNLTQYDYVEHSGKEFGMTLVAIDCGHGSNTAGKRTVDGYKEHTINVKTALYCEKYLNSVGIKTIRVGWNDANANDDVDVPLSDRQKQIKNAKCDYSVSIHANAYGNGSVWTTPNGVETIYHSNILYQKDSKKLATSVQNRIVQGTQQTNRGVKTQSLAMCNCLAMGTKASVLVEIAFMTNKKEAELMKSESFCKEQGEDIAKGICDYLLSKGTNIKTEPTVVVNTNPVTDTAYNLVFDAVYYANKYPDLKKAFGYDEVKLLNHFKTFGIKEGRQAISTFNVVAYKNRYEDLRKAFGDDLEKYVNHYIYNGYREKRIGI